MILRASTDAAGNQGNGGSQNASVSADGRYAAFDSNASNLVYGDTNGTTDVFVKDVRTGAITRASTDSTGRQVQGNSTNPSISADGRYVAFTSSACSLAPGYCSRNTTNVYVKDMQTGATSRVSADASANPGNGSSANAAVSSDGRYVASNSNASNLVPGDTNSTTDVFVKDTRTGATTRVSTASDGTQGNGESYWPAISADGRYVAFDSYADNLVPGDTNGAADVFLATGSGASCSGGKPLLSLSESRVSWASLADFYAGSLSVDFSVANGGGIPAYAVEITGVTADSGVTSHAVVPSSLGNITGGDSHPLTVKYTVPAGVTAFRTSMTATAEDGCSAPYSYP